jgi:O-antigen ligase
MNTPGSHAAPADPGPPTRGSRPWAWFLLLTGVFYVAHPHSLVASRILLDHQAADQAEQQQADTNAAAVDDGSMRRRVSLLVLVVVAMGSCLRGGDRRLAIQGVMGWSMVAFAALVVVSPLWSATPFLSLRRVISFGFLVIGAVAVACRFCVEDLMLLVVLAASFYLGLGVLAEITAGTFRPGADGYRFAGTLHPNRQGMNCALLIMASLALGSRRPSRWKYWILATVAAGFLVLTGSRTSLASGLVGLGVWWGLTVAPLRLLTNAILGIVCLLPLLLIAASWQGDRVDDAVRSMLLLGRTSGDSGDATLTGRVPLWQECADYAAEHWLLGFGYKSFWSPKRILQVSDNQGWSIMAAHNGYLETVLNVGVVGLALFGVILAAGILRAWRLARSTRGPAAAFAAAVLCWLAANSLLESWIDEPILPAFVALTLLSMLGLMQHPDWMVAGTQEFRTEQVADPKLSAEWALGT